jgi:hypothetical protein
LQREFVWRPQVIGIEEGDDIAGCLGEAAVACGGATCVLRVSQHDEIGSRNLRHFGKRAVGGCIVYDDDFDRLQRLRARSRDRVLDRCDRVESGNDD